MVMIEEGAIFVADAHYPHHGDALPKLLDQYRVWQSCDHSAIFNG